LGKRFGIPRTFGFENKVDVSYKEGADNIDINTETIDGKDTFHSMAMAVFQVCPSPISLESDLKITQRISETFSICPAQFEIISKALRKRFGIPRTFGFENGRHDICEECQEMTKSLGQAYSIQTFDQQLYAIAKQVEWAKQDTFKTHILLLGGFHTM
jgi:hypothetical protein